jgi:hypothetical protein
LLNSGSEKTLALLKRWVEGCSNQHTYCRETLSSNFQNESICPYLPTRVIDVGTVDSTQAPKLIEAGGRKAKYAALSHCWGPPDKRPLTTTRSSVYGHLREISWTALPKTFQNVIHVTRNIGLRYIWVDSLCIVQDDHEDWHRESIKMGSIYEHPELTIAASHASDSSRALFLPRSSSPPSVTLPNFLTHAHCQGLVLATVMREDHVDISPELGPLNSRAWATQEWLLFRRMVFYTDGQIIWSCKTITQRETGEKCYNTARNVKWKIIAEHFSEQHLAKPTDRLIALEGLRTEVQKKSGDSYLSGLWKSRISFFGRSVRELKNHSIRCNCLLGLGRPCRVECGS